MRPDADAAVPVVRDPVRCFHAVLRAGLAVHPFGRDKTDEVRVGLLHWYDLLRCRKIYVEWTEDATALDGRVAQAALLACFGGVDAAYLICVLRARELLFGGRGVGVASMCITVLLVRRHAGRNCGSEVSGEGHREDL